jgi:hypothetical protein
MAHGKLTMLACLPEYAFLMHDGDHVLPFTQ